MGGVSIDSFALVAINDFKVHEECAGFFVRTHPHGDAVGFIDHAANLFHLHVKVLTLQFSLNWIGFLHLFQLGFISLFHQIKRLIAKGGRNSLAMDLCCKIELIGQIA